MPCNWSHSISIMSTRGFSAAVFSTAAISISMAIAFYMQRKRTSIWQKKIHDLETSLQNALKNRAAERKGRIRAQQALRKALAEKSEDAQSFSYPMKPIGIVQSCFSLRNGTPRQPLLISNARACLVLNPEIPSASIDGLVEYSHCWILFVFHKNTDLAKLWQKTGNSDFRAKVRVPRLQGDKRGVFATRSPHRPCPIGLSVAKVEGIHDRFLLLSGIDLVDGTPVLDIKPYLPYCDNVVGTVVPDWIKGDGVDDPLSIATLVFSEDFATQFAKCWEIKRKESLYASSNEFKTLIEQVLSRDIRSFSQRQKPHKSTFGYSSTRLNENDSILQDDNDEEVDVMQTGSLEKTNGSVMSSQSPEHIVEYHLILEGINITYTIDAHSNVVVQSAALSADINGNLLHHCNNTVWSNITNNLQHEVPN